MLKPKVFIVIVLLLIACEAQKRAINKTIVYETETLKITQVTENSFVHTSYLETQDWGNVPCNGAIFTNNQQAIVFDTPIDDKTSVELIEWLKQQEFEIKAIIPTHFHEDCLGGLNAFHESGLTSFAYQKTIDFAIVENNELPKMSFQDAITLYLGEEKVVVKFFGEGHTQDNVVGYFPKEKVLFGGCLIKAIGASKGNLADANEKEWSKTVKSIKNAYPKVEVVIPGHGNFGNTELLDYTIQLFQD
ncbi:subclass B1 metallo-beta-lactamase [Mesonia sp. K7]|uniref:subclass B1 metallo-beta-lactamase n=1 Tax=Mesonia sp. K7 TaxID=2218606 RepID=UPI000DA786C9|nr:subclass B1 metallo-beta-lactamase [Mesonia sp. K7]PZD79063.1 subclass B1 metallo-beta-lactamase [Mesonia sp. K7]